MASWLERIMGSKNKSADQAKERLKFVLIHDRTDLSPQALEDMKNDIIEVISRHVQIDANKVKINMSQEGREQRLIADIPILPVRGRRAR
jgi:cell division topological specificity factor